MAQELSAEEQIEALEALGFTIEDEDDPNSPVSDVDAELEALGFEIGNEEVPDPAPEPEVLDAISTQMYAGMTFADAQQRYDDITSGPNVTNPIMGLGYAVYKDPETGRREFIPRPLPRMFGEDGLIKNFGRAAIKTVTGDFSGAASEFDDTAATVSATDKIILGGSESLGGLVESGAAVAEKAGMDGALDAVSPLVVNIDTGDSFTDAMLTDAVPAAVAAIGTGGVISTAVKGYPLLIRALATAVPAEVAASLTTSTDEGTMFLGENAAIKTISNGIDLGDEEADKILEQRLNVLGEGLALTSGFSGVLPVGAKLLELGGKFAFFPIYAAIAGGSAMERRIYERIANQLAQIDEGASPQQIMEVRRQVAKTIEENKDVVVPMLRNMDENQTVTLDTVSSLLRGTDDPAMRTTAGGILQGQLQRGGRAPLTVAAVEQPQAVLQSEIRDYLAEVGGKTSADQTATMGAAADELAGQGRQFVQEGDAAVVAATQKFDVASEAVVKGFRDDLEFGQQLDALEDLVGTEIVTGQTSSFQSVRDGLKSAYSTMTNRKNDLYNAIPEGTTFDIAGFGDALEVATQNANDFSTVGQQLLGKRLINTLRKAYGRTEPLATTDEFMRVVDGSQAVPMDQVVKEIAESGVDFKVLYTKVRPEIAKLIDEAFTNGEKEVGRRLIDIKNSIDDQVEWIAENGGEAAADAATAARDYYKGVGDEVGYAEIWRGGGRMEEFGNLYDPVFSRGVGDAGFQEGSRDLVKDILSGQNADAVSNMARALQQVQNPAPIADYMVADVINGFAGEIRSKGLSGASLAKFSENLQQYSEALNQVFPERAAKVNQFIRAVNQAAGSKAELENVLTLATETAEATRNAVKQSELGGFLRQALGSEFDTTTGPYNAFKTIFGDSKDGIGKLSDIKARLAELPEARRQVVQDGMEAAYMRMLGNKVSAAKMESGGSQSLKMGSIDGLMQESDQVLEVGRLLFSDKPEFMNGLSDLLEVSRMVGKGKGATPVAAFSPTVFNAEATKATNRLIMTFIGALSRPGARLRALAGGIFDQFDPTRRAEMMLDNIFANPDEYLRLSRKYDVDPMDLAVKENLITGLTTGFLKGVNAEVSFLEDQNNVSQQMKDLVP